MSLQESKVSQKIYLQNLPIELRIIIWELAASQIIEVRWASHTGFVLHNSHELGVQAVCKESRAIVSRMYDSKRVEFGGRNITFDPERDVLYFPYPFPCATSYGRSLRSFFVRHPQFHGLKHLALSLPYSSLDEEITKKFLHDIRHSALADNPSFKLSLDSMTLIVQDPFCYALKGESSLFVKTTEDIPVACLIPDFIKIPELIRDRFCNFNWDPTAADLSRVIGLYDQPSLAIWGAPEILWKGVVRGTYKFRDLSIGWSNFWRTPYVLSEEFRQDRVAGNIIG